MYGQIAVLIFLVALNAFFAGSELAFVSLNNNKLKNMKEEGNRKAGVVLSLKENPNQFLSTIQIGVSLASILSGAFASDAFAEVITNWSVAQFNLSATLVRPIAMIVVTLITSYLMLVFGELVPKRIAMSNSEKFAFFVCYPISFLSKITKPIVKFLSFSTNIVLRLVGIDPNSVEDEVTEEEIRIMVEAGEINIEEKEMIRNIFEFDNHTAEDIMTHRTDIIGVDINSTFEDIMNIVDEERFTRYPVYDDSIDDIIGILHLRDLLRYVKSSNGKDFDIHEIMWEPLFVPDSKKTDTLFRELQNAKTHIAIVIDEYGGTAGLVTMEDLIEEVMGNIMDEYDDEEGHEIVEVHPGEYLVDGLVDLDELDDVLDIELPIDDYDTLSGFLISFLDRIPNEDDIKFDTSDVVYKGYRFSIVDVDEKVISKVRITKEKQDDEDLLEEN
ncbi:HlyC/CorC family transporter [Erysipelothrix sp. HDW6A]|uniref:hemolysin family protein n=1 Tax=Erysipelothrix sp. HDW6A TaxID=2714928 RepID=UPI00140763A2|nr:hemolysin family protein [Erysipelothrix sp. HDW6A]QIK57713.1 HlyC/CorC family transporter [Erysipelothrix sp. HDW6A]